MSSIRRYPRRSATSGNVTLHSARKYDETCKYWYFLNAGPASCGRDEWIQFDVRVLAHQVGRFVPALCGEADFSAIRSGAATFESILERDLQRVADFCAEVRAVEVLACKSN